jgi:hypothetical protein
MFLAMRAGLYPGSRRVWTACAAILVRERSDEDLPPVSPPGPRRPRGRQKTIDDVDNLARDARERPGHADDDLGDPARLSASRTSSSCR